MVPSVRECQPGQAVKYLDPVKRQWCHGYLITSGPRWSFVWDAPSRPCIKVATSDIEPEE